MTSTTSYDFGDVVLVEFPQFSSPERKRRPALVILDIGDQDVLLAPITTRRWAGRGDFLVAGWAAAGLLRESWVRLAKLSTLQKQDVSRRLGALSKEDRATASQVLSYLLGGTR